LLKKYLDKYYIVYLNDILIFIKTLEEYMKIVYKILQILIDISILLKPSKYKFHIIETKFFGYIVSIIELKISLNKVKEVLE
jgi:hypothetical protein